MVKTLRRLSTSASELEFEKLEKIEICTNEFLLHCLYGTCISHIENNYHSQLLETYTVKYSQVSHFCYILNV